MLSERPKKSTLLHTSKPNMARSISHMPNLLTKCRTLTASTTITSPKKKSLNHCVMMLEFLNSVLAFLSQVFSHFGTALGPFRCHTQTKTRTLCAFCRVGKISRLWVRSSEVSSIRVSRMKHQGSSTPKTTPQSTLTGHSMMSILSSKRQRYIRYESKMETVCFCPLFGGIESAARLTFVLRFHTGSNPITICQVSSTNTSLTSRNE